VPQGEPQKVEAALFFPAPLPKWRDPADGPRGVWRTARCGTGRIPKLFA